MKERDFNREHRKQRRLEQIGANRPQCPRCGETDWRCFEATSMPQCANCQIKSGPMPPGRCKQRRLKQLGTDRPICGMCGEAGWRCLEAHHVAGRRHDPRTVILCANDHLRVTDDQKDHLSTENHADPLLDKIGRFLLGLADMLRVIVDMLIEFGDALIAQARH
jgi:hypothetical protein